MFDLRRYRRCRMTCLYCNKPIVKYPAFSQYDPDWVHERDSGKLGSQYCEDVHPSERIASTIATPEQAVTA